jgi:hypothetical protein
MPFKSKAQQRYLYSQAPDVAKEFSSETTNMKGLPDRVNPKGSIKNKPVTPAFKPGRKKTKPLASYSYGENSES